ncbi:unnamed protein product, partial [Porites lobata]
VKPFQASDEGPNQADDKDDLPNLPEIKNIRRPSKQLKKGGKAQLRIYIRRQRTLMNPKATRKIITSTSIGLRFSGEKENVE